MGQCCGKPAKYGAFREDLGSPLIADLSSKLPPTARVVMVNMSCLRDIVIGNSYAGTSDPFVEIKVIPNDPVAGSQRKVGAVKPNTVNPTWFPPESFQLVVSNPANSRVLISVYHFNVHNPAKSLPLGDGVLKLKDLPEGSGTLPQPHTVKLKNPETGQSAGEAEVTVQILTIAEAAAVQHHIIFEFQRWQPIIEWGHTEAPGHFLPTDPGRWCTADGKHFANDIDNVAPPIPAGWTISNSWHTVSSDTDPEGWQYSTLFMSPYWHDKSESTYVVRRRAWYREIRLSADATVNPITGRSDSQSSNSGRRKRMFSTEPKK